MVVAEAKILSEIFRIIAEDPDPDNSVTLDDLTNKLNAEGFKVRSVDVMGYLIQQQEAGVMRVEPVGEYGSPHVRMTLQVRR
jgi:hypothetical protein